MKLWWYGEIPRTINAPPYILGCEETVTVPEGIVRVCVNMLIDDDVMVSDPCGVG